MDALDGGTGGSAEENSSLAAQPANGIIDQNAGNTTNALSLVGKTPNLRT